MPINLRPLLYSILTIALLPTIALAAPGDQLYHFQVQDPDTGREYQIDTQAANRLILTFVSPGLPPCERQVDILQQLEPQLTQAGFSFLILDTGRSIEATRTLQRQLQDSPIAVGWASPSTMLLFESVKLYPTVFVMDADGVIRYERMGISDAEQIRKAAERVLAQDSQALEWPIENPQQKKPAQQLPAD